jgi:tetratricopeptide (TPR) repeat protein
VLETADPATSVRAVFMCSYRNLSGPAARMFRLLGVHPGPDISAPAAASLTGIPADQARRVLGELAGAHLLAEHVPGRFAFHDLLRAYAAEQARGPGNDDERRAAIHRMLDHYLHSAHTGALTLEPAQDSVTLVPARPGTAPEHLAGQEQALAWFQAEYQVLLAAIALAAEARFDTHAWQIPWALATFFYRRGHWQEWADTPRTALAAAQRLGDTAGQAYAHRNLGRACLRRGSYDEAHFHLSQALSLYQQLDDPAGQASAHLSRSKLFEVQRHYDQALGHAQQALGLAQATGDRTREALALNGLGWCHAHLGEHQRALACCEQALGIFRELGDYYGAAATLDSLGYINHHLGDCPQAVACYQQALDLYHELGDRLEEATTLIRIGDAQLAAAEPEWARDAWKQGLAILSDLRQPGTDAVRAKLSRLRTDPQSP